MIQWLQMKPLNTDYQKLKFITERLQIEDQKVCKLDKDRNNNATSVNLHNTLQVKPYVIQRELISNTSGILCTSLRFVIIQ